MYWHKLIETYENTQGICPVAHTMITVHIGIMIDKDGNFLCAKDCSILKELTPVPCTVKSETRTCNIAPHLISDNYSYIGNVNKEKHNAYLKQLKDYVENYDDVYAKAVYAYVVKGTLEDDLRKFDIADYLPSDNIIFAVKDVGYVNKWTDYYTQQLPKTDVCYITGEMDYMPSAYPSRILSPSGKEKLFMQGCGVGYIASQKIIHTLQFLNYIKVVEE